MTALAFLTRWPAACALLALAFSLVLGSMVADRAGILRSGDVITLTPEPVDPRDLFRGDYVILSYPGLAPPFTETENRGRTYQVKWPVAEGLKAWVLLERESGGQDAGAWRTRAIERALPSGATPGANGENQIWLRARVDGYGSDREITVRRLYFGIERYYVPEGEGLALEKLIGQKRIQVAIAVGSDGRAAIKGLSVDGETVYEEPWF